MLTFKLSLWMFVLVTALATIGFYHLRKMCKL